MRGKKSQMEWEQSLKACFRCKKDFHLKCFRASCKMEKNELSDNKNGCTSGKIICGHCENHIQTTLKKETLISDYFKPKKIIFNDVNNFTNSNGNKGINKVFIIIPLIF